MPPFGVVSTVQHAPAVAGAGFDYLEVNAQHWLEGTVPDDAYAGVARFRAGCPLPIPAVVNLMPGDLKIVGPDVDAPAVKTYLERVVRRAAGAGVETLVFGSGEARRVPDGYDPLDALGQLFAFCALAARLAREAGLVVALEPLCSAETNTLNTLVAATRVAEGVNDAGLGLLVDTYHLWAEAEPTRAVELAAPLLRHVHVADPATRLAPGDAAHADRYRAVFAALKRANYAGRVSVEGKIDFAPDALRRTLAFLREQWDAA